jgi:hypothetical protein
VSAVFEFLNHRLAAAFMRLDHRDSRSLISKQFGDSFADISSGTGNHRHLAFQFHLILLLSTGAPAQLNDLEPVDPVFRF